MAIGSSTAAEELGVLFRVHATPLLRLAVVLTGDRALSEEMVQEAFLRLQSSKSVPAAGAELAYLRRTIINLSHGHHRHVGVMRRRPVDAPGISEPPDQRVVRRDVQRRVADAVRALPGRQRDCVVLRYYAELSDSQIAEVLGIGAGSVKTHIFRGRAALVRSLEALR